MTAVMEQRPSSVNRMKPDAFPAQGVPVFTAITSSETAVTWSASADSGATSSDTNPCNGIIRWYDPVTGRWLSNDPIGISGGLNQYVFCNNNPVNFRDPFGTCPDGESFAASYNELLMRNPYWPPYVVNTFLARGDIDIGENRRNTQYRYMGGRLPADVVGNRVAGQSLISTYGAFAPLLAVIAEGANSLDPTKRGQDKLAAADASIRDNFIGMGKEWAEHPVHTTAITAGSLLVPYLALPVNWASDRLGR